MRELLHQFMNRQISRRSFGKGLAALGLSAVAVESVVQNLAAAQQPPAAEGVAFTGTGAEVLVETLRAAGVAYVFGTTSTGMSAFFDALTLRSEPQMILALAESQATSMAQGYELATGQTSVLIVPGVAVPSTMNNLYNAWKDRSSKIWCWLTAAATISKAAMASSRWITGWNPWSLLPSGAGSCVTNGRSPR